MSVSNSVDRPNMHMWIREHACGSFFLELLVVCAIISSMCYCYWLLTRITNKFILNQRYLFLKENQ
jgi:hypothetical protein